MSLLNRDGKSVLPVPLVPSCAKVPWPPAWLAKPARIESLPAGDAVQAVFAAGVREVVIRAELSAGEFESYQERAAIREFDGRVSRDEAERLALAEFG